MAYSLLVPLSSEREHRKRAFSSLHAEIGKSSLSLQGIYSDRNWALEKIVNEIKIKGDVHDLSSTVASVITALAPQNVPVNHPSFLSRPFFLDERTKREMASEICAGEFAHISESRNPSSCFDRTIRYAQTESLTLIAVSVLRRLGLPAAYSFQHHNNNEPSDTILANAYHSISFPRVMPCIVLLCSKGNIAPISIMPPFDQAHHDNAIAIEIVDDGTLFALLKLRETIAKIRLASDFAGKNIDAKKYVYLAYCVGHELFEMSRALCLTIAASMAAKNPAGENISGVAEIANDFYLEPISSSSGMMFHGLYKMIPKSLLEMFCSVYVSNDRSSRGLLMEKVKKTPKLHRALLDYSAFTEIVEDHRHAADDCQIQVKS